MGNDGGSIANARKIVVKRKKVVRPQGNDEKRQIKWGTCAMSGEPLRLPLVVDHHGNLMNQEAVMRFILKQITSDSFAHIKKYKRDVVELKVSAEAAGTEPAAASDTRSFYAASVRPVFRCPITLRGADGTRPFVVLYPCGHVFSLEGLTQFAPDGEAAANCPSCSVSYSEDDIIEINPSDAARSRMEDAIQRRKAARSAARKSKSESGAATGGGGVARSDDATPTREATSGIHATPIIAGVPAIAEAPTLGGKRQRADAPEGEHAGEATAGAAAAVQDDSISSDANEHADTSAKIDAKRPRVEVGV